MQRQACNTRAVASSCRLRRVAVSMTDPSPGAPKTSWTQRPHARQPMGNPMPASTPCHHQANDVRDDLLEIARERLGDRP